MMKKIDFKSLFVAGFSAIILFSLSLPAAGQDTRKISSAIPEDVNKIVSASCTPCHTSEGGLMSRSKLNLTEWARYSPEKQKEKSAKMYYELSKGAMPPKVARQKHPELIPTAEQIETIKKWSESFPPDKK